MKRDRQHDDMEDQFRRLMFLPPREAAGQPRPLAVNSWRKPSGNCMKYLQDVKDVFQDKIETYDDFLKIFREYKAQRYQDLILGFNRFLPEEHKFTLSDVKQKKQTRDICDFIEKFKERFKEGSPTSNSFLAILILYKERRKSHSEVYKEISVLLHGHDDLLADFALFRPGSSTTASVLPQNRVDKKQSVETANTCYGPNDVATHSITRQNRKLFSRAVDVSAGHSNQELHRKDGLS